MYTLNTHTPFAEIMQNIYFIYAVLFGKAAILQQKYVYFTIVCEFGLCVKMIGIKETNKSEQNTIVNVF